MVLHMSRKERDRLKVIEQIDRRHLSQVQAARLLQTSRVTLWKKMTRYRIQPVAKSDG